MDPNEKLDRLVAREHRKQGSFLTKLGKNPLTYLSLGLGSLAPHAHGSVDDAARNELSNRPEVVQSVGNSSREYVRMNHVNDYLNIPENNTDVIRGLFDQFLKSQYDGIAQNGAIYENVLDQLSESVISNVVMKDSYNHIIDMSNQAIEIYKTLDALHLPSEYDATLRTHYLERIFERNQTLDLETERTFLHSIPQGTAITVPEGKKLHEFLPEYIQGFENMSSREQKAVYDELSRINPHIFYNGSQEINATTNEIGITLDRSKNSVVTLEQSGYQINHYFRAEPGKTILIPHSKTYLASK